MACDSGRARLLKLNMTCLPDFLAAAAISSTSGALSAGGFSQKTCLPALRHWMASGAWNLLGTMMLTAWSSGRSLSIASTDS